MSEAFQRFMQAFVLPRCGMEDHVYGKLRKRLIPFYVSFLQRINKHTRIVPNFHVSFLLFSALPVNVCLAVVEPSSAKYVFHLLQTEIKLYQRSKINV